MLFDINPLGQDEKPISKHFQKRNPSYTVDAYDENRTRNMCVHVKELLQLKIKMTICKISYCELSKLQAISQVNVLSKWFYPHQ